MTHYGYTEEQLYTIIAQFLFEHIDIDTTRDTIGYYESSNSDEYYFSFRHFAQKYFILDKEKYLNKIKSNTSKDEFSFKSKQLEEKLIKKSEEIQQRLAEKSDKLDSRTKNI